MKTKNAFLSPQIITVLVILLLGFMAFNYATTGTLFSFADILLPEENVTVSLDGIDYTMKYKPYTSEGTRSLSGRAYLNNENNIITLSSELRQNSRTSGSWAVTPVLTVNKDISRAEKIEYDLKTDYTFTSDHPSGGVENILMVYIKDSQSEKQIVYSQMGKVSNFVGTETGGVSGKLIIERVNNTFRSSGLTMFGNSELVHQKISDIDFTQPVYILFKHSTGCSNNVGCSAYTTTKIMSATYFVTPDVTSQPTATNTPQTESSTETQDNTITEADITPLDNEETTEQDTTTSDEDKSIFTKIWEWILKIFS